MSATETIVPLPCAPHAVPLAQEIRSTTLVSSLNTLRAAGLEEAYSTHMSEQDAQVLLNLVPGKWVPMRLAMVHYAAVERLRLGDDTARANGRRVAESIQNSYVSTIVRAVGSALPVWVVIARCPTLLARLVKGGACAVYKCGDKDARIELHGIPIARYRYVRCGWAGMFEGTLGMVVKGVAAVDRSPVNTQNVAAFAISWL